jgi:hypothetical protein
VSRVLSVVLMGRDTGHPHLLAPNLLTGGKGADLVIRGNVVLNTDLLALFTIRQHRHGCWSLGIRCSTYHCEAASIDTRRTMSHGLAW